MLSWEFTKCERSRHATKIFKMNLPIFRVWVRRLYGGGEKVTFSDGKVYFVFKVFLISNDLWSRTIKKRNGVSRYFPLLPFPCSFSVKVRSRSYFSTDIILLWFHIRPGSRSKLMAAVFDSDMVHKFLSNGRKRIDLF